MKRLLILTLGLLLLGCSKESLSSLGDVYGTVTDSATGAPIKQVEISIKPGDLTTLSDSNGRYKFSRLDEGTYTVTATASGYEEESRQVEIVSSMRTMCDFKLSPIGHSEHSTLVVEPTYLNFGDSTYEMSITIRNTGDEEFVWEATIPDYPAVSLSEISDTVAGGDSQVISVMVNRDYFADNILDTTFTISNGKSEQSVIVTAMKPNNENDKSERMTVMPKYIDFGMYEEEKSITVVNIADSTINWFITDEGDKALSFSESVGTIAPNNSASFTIYLDRSKLRSDLKTEVVITDGISTEHIEVEATYVEDYSMVDITTIDPLVDIEVISCKRTGSTVTFDFTMQNNGLGHPQQCRIYSPTSNSSKTVIIDNLGNEYNGYNQVQISFRGGNYSSSSVETAFPEDVKCKCSFRITNVPDEVTSFSKIQVHAILYNYNPTFASDVMIFKNVPIY